MIGQLNSSFQLRGQGMVNIRTAVATETAAMTFIATGSCHLEAREKV
jgi:hypothetical protein